MRTGKCYKCGTEIWFGETEKGRTVPINVWTSPRGKIVIVAGDEEADKPMVRWLKKDEEVPETARRYISHLATCRPRRAA